MTLPRRSCHSFLFHRSSESDVLVEGFKTTNGEIVSTKNVHQGVLENSLNTLFQSYSGIKNTKKEVSLKNPLTGKYLEVDVWYPDLQLCFEYQDEHHYQSIWYCQKSLSIVQEEDNIKSNLLWQRGETLIVIPCWWDGSSESLQATINFHRPDLFQNCEKTKNEMIPINPPFNFFSEDVQLMLASFPNSVDLVDVNELNQWWLGEKYDGVRCFWNPREKQLYSRHGLMIEVHPSVNRLFGNIVLDGEIWCGRGLFLETNFLLQANLEKLNWASFRVVCFDEASQAMTNQPFEKRYSLILSHFLPDHPTTIIAPRFLCENSLSLTQNLQQIVEEGGEGIILRKSFSLYHPGRSFDLVKLKGSREDQEALVVDIEEDGSLLLQLAEGVTFEVPKMDCILHRKVSRGDVVSFTYDFASRRNATHGDATAHAQDAELRSVPSNPLVYRIRDDLAWEDVLHSSSLPPTLQFLNEPHQKIDSFPQKPVEGHKNYKKEEMRNHLEYLARKKGFDPLIAENWYKIPRQEFIQYWSVKRFVDRYFSSNFAKAIVSLFPELNLDISKFSSTHKFWNNVQNRRVLFERFARAKGEDPLDPKFWYSVRIAELMCKKGYVETVMHVFPELHLNRNKFKPQKVYRWKDAEKKRLVVARPSKGSKKVNSAKAKLWEFTWKRDRREFFDNFAKVQKFDPLIPENWYNVSAYSLSQFQGYNTIIEKYGGRLSDCLMHLYPSIGLQKSKFIIHVRDRKAFFDKFAETHKFDPLVADNWYNVSPFSLSQHEGCKTSMQYYKGDLADCLMDIYPHIGLQKSKVAKYTMRTRDRIFFDKFAKAQGFDPLVPENWYSALSQEYKVLLKYFRGKLSDGLMQIYPDIGLQPEKFKQKQNVKI